MADIYAKTFKFGENGDTLHLLPIVTQEDEDKILIVKNGEWKADSPIDANTTKY